MKVEIDVAKIREKLEKALSYCDAASETAEYIEEAKALLPKPCEKCGGSGEKFIGITGRTDPVYETCPTCKGSGLKPSPCGNYDLDDPCDECWGKGQVETEEAKPKPCETCESYTTGECVSKIPCDMDYSAFKPKPCQRPEQQLNKPLAGEIEEKEKEDAV